jgi:transposase-like protein
MPKKPWLRKRAAEARKRASELQERSAHLRAESDALRGEAAGVRASSTALPRCPTCGHDETKPALRTDLVQYFRCPRCAFVWSRPNPDADAAPKTA